MEKITLNLYNINELSNESKQYAIEQYQKTNDYVDLYFFKEDVTEQLKELGWNNIELQYSLGYCQGDGLSFSGKLDLEWFLKNKYSKKLSKYKIWAISEYVYSIFSEGNKGHYSYSSKDQIEFDYNYQDNKQRKNIDKLWQDVLIEIKNDYVRTCREFEKRGYDEIEYQNSDEYIIDYFESNDIKFLENGRLFQY